MRSSRLRVSALAVLIAGIVTARASAHVLDECVQAVRVDVGPDRLDLDLTLTPGVAVAGAIISDIDRNRDGTLSADEQRRYVHSLLAKVAVTVDRQPLQLEPGASTFADPGTLMRGEGTIQVQAGVVLPWLAGGPHQLVVRNTYRPEFSVYLANALVPESDRVAITSQRHNADQSSLTIDYSVSAGTTSWVMPLFWSLGAIAAVLTVVVPGFRLTDSRSVRL